MGVRKVLGWVLAHAVVLVAAAAPAFATTQNLSGTVTTAVPANFTDDSSTNAANATGASDANYLTLSHAVGNHGPVVWTISGALSGWSGNNVGLTFYTTHNSMTVSVTQIRFTDSGGNTARLSTSLSIATGTQSTTINTNISSYTLVGAFSVGNVTTITFDFTVSANGNKALGLDALDVVTTTVPEPSTVALFSLGVAGLGAGLLRRRARRRARGRARPPGRGP